MSLISNEKPNQNTDQRAIISVPCPYITCVTPIKTRTSALDLARLHQSLSFWMEKSICPPLAVTHATHDRAASVHP